MKALTVWQPWASLIVAGLKPHEYRRWPAPASLVGQRIVIHAASRRLSLHDIHEVRNMPEPTCAPFPRGVRAIDVQAFLTPFSFPGGEKMPHAAGLGTAVLGRPVRAVDLHGPTWRGQNVDPDVWGWPLLDPQPFERPQPCRGAQGFWTWPELPAEWQP